MKCETISQLKLNHHCPFVTVIGRNAAGVPVYRIEAILEYNNEKAKEIFHNGLKEGKVVKTLLDETKIKSLVILDSGEIHPSSFHYTTLKQRCQKYITFVTIVGPDACGINIDKINLIINYKFDNSNKVVDELLNKNYFIRLTYDSSERTKSLIITDTKTVYPSTFNYATIRRRIHNREDLDEDDIEKVI